MKRMRLLAVVLAGGLAIAACGGGDDDDSAGKDDGGGAPSAEEGKTLFGSTCSSCHGQDAKGMVNLGKNLVSSDFVKDTSDADLLAFINKGRPTSDPANTTKVDMPAKGGNPSLTDDDIKSIIAYMRTINVGGGGTDNTAG